MAEPRHKEPSRFKIILAVVVAVAAVIVVLQNTEQVETQVLFVSVAMPRAVLLFVTLAAGYVLGLLTLGRRKKG